MKIAVCTTLAAFVMEEVGTWASWYINAEAVRANAPAGCEVDYFASIELDARGIEPFKQLTDMLDADTRGDYWTYHLDDRRTSITTANRLRHLTMGQNLASEFASSGGYDWMLFLATDTCPPDDVLPKLLEMNHPLVGCEIPTYCLSGPSVHGYAFPVQEQLISAAAIFIHKSVFKQIRWRADGEAGMSDDPAYKFDAETLLGVKSYVRKDCIARHYPESISSIETRFPNRDMKVYRGTD